MAAIGKIRSWGPVLATVIGLALFAFIAEEMFRSCDARNNERRQQVGEVLGKTISVQDFQSMVDEYKSIVVGRDNLSDEESNRVNDMVWQQYVRNTILEVETEKLGLTVTDAELQDILKAGTNPMLMNTPFTNQQTGRFDVTQLTMFLSEYKKMQGQPQQAQMAEQYKQIYDYWKYLEKQLRMEVLREKYETLIAQCMISNPVSAKMAFEAQTQESNVLLASLPYAAINDNDVQVSDADLKAKYNEQKEMYRQYVETRDIKYVDFQVLPSKADRDSLMRTMNDARQKLESGAAPAEVVRKAHSQVPYTGIAATKRAFTPDVAARLDSMQVGQVTEAFESAYDNTMNVVKLIAKSQAPDSVEYRQIQVAGETVEAARKTADSIYTALKGGADFEAIAKKYGQTGEKEVLTSSSYETATSIDADNMKYLTALTTLAPNELQNIEFVGGNIIVQVLSRKAMVTKYDVAVIKTPITFSNETYSQAYNKFSQYVSENKTLEDMEKNAQKFGFRVQERKRLLNSEHNVAGLRSTRDAMKWIFDAKAGEISPLYECGNNDHLLVIALTNVTPVGYCDLASVEDEVKQEVIADKKFLKAKDMLQGVNSFDAAKQKGALVDTIPQATFAAPFSVRATSSTEPALSGAVAAAKVGEFHAVPVKGKGGAYLFKVIDRKQRENAKFDAKLQQDMLKQEAADMLLGNGRYRYMNSHYMNDLYLKAKVVDNRYLFF